MKYHLYLYCKWCKRWRWHECLYSHDFDGHFVQIVCLKCKKRNEKRE